jgi:hypothetical protein
VWARGVNPVIGTSSAGTTIRELAKDSRWDLPQLHSKIYNRVALRAYRSSSGRGGRLSGARWVRNEVAETMAVPIAPAARGQEARRVCGRRREPSGGSREAGTARVRSGQHVRGQARARCDHPSVVGPSVDRGAERLDRVVLVLLVDLDRDRAAFFSGPTDV